MLSMNMERMWEGGGRWGWSKSGGPGFPPGRVRRSLSRARSASNNFSRNPLPFSLLVLPFTRRFSAATLQMTRVLLMKQSRYSLLS